MWEEDDDSAYDEMCDRRMEDNECIRCAKEMPKPPEPPYMRPAKCPECAPKQWEKYNERKCSPATKFNNIVSERNGASYGYYLLLTYYYSGKLLASEIDELLICSRIAQRG